MISLRPSTRIELASFDEMDRQQHARNFITQIGLETHQDFFDEPSITYLSSVNNKGELAGYFVLVMESDQRNLEFRRIAIDQAKRGIGQEAIREMERYCRSRLGVKRIWLDVFEDNVIGRHIYEKLGYTYFKTESLEGRALLFYETSL